MTGHGVGQHNMIDASVGDRFRLGESIGSGSYSTVYGATDESTATPVALKVLKGGEDTLLAEASLLAAIRHPNVVGYYASGRETAGPLAGRVWLAMELADRTLADLLDSAGGTLPWEMLKPIVVDILRGVAYLHGQEPPIIHRDIKPDNILDFGGRWAVGDLGLSTSNSATEKGAEAYRAPELKRGVVPTVSSDLWAVGKLVEKALGGAPTAALVGSEQTAQLLRSLKARYKKDRPESAVFVLDDLAPSRGRTQKMRTGSASSAGPNEPTGEHAVVIAAASMASARSKRTKRWLAVAAAVALVGVGVAATQAGGRDKKDKGDLAAGDGSKSTTSVTGSTSETTDSRRILPMTDNAPKGSSGSNASTKAGDVALIPPAFVDEAPVVLVPPSNPITPPPAGEKLPAFKNAEDRIAYVGDAQGTGLYTMTKTGTDHQVAAYGIINSPSWSPSHDRIAFVKRDAVDTDPYLVVVNAQGQTVTPLGKSGTGKVSSPSWSPDGKWVLVKTAGLGAMRVEVDTEKRVAFSPPCPAFYPSWSPDGGRIAFVAQAKAGGQCDGGFYLYTSTPEGTQLKQLTTVANAASHPDWSADSNKIAYSSRELRSEGELGSDIFVVNADGSNTGRITTDGDASLIAPRWVGNSNAIVYSRVDGDTKVQVFQVSGDGGGNGSQLVTGQEADG